MGFCDYLRWFCSGVIAGCEHHWRVFRTVVCSFKDFYFQGLILLFPLFHGAQCRICHTCPMSNHMPRMFVLKWYLSDLDESGVWPRSVGWGTNAPVVWSQIHGFTSTVVPALRGEGIVPCEKTGFFLSLLSHRFSHRFSHPFTSFTLDRGFNSTLQYRGLRYEDCQQGPVCCNVTHALVSWRQAF